MTAVSGRILATVNESKKCPVASPTGHDYLIGKVLYFLAFFAGFLAAFGLAADFVAVFFAGAGPSLDLAGLFLAALAFGDAVAAALAPLPKAFSHPLAY